MKVGDIFEEKYELLELLGAGGVGTVYRARQIEFDRIVALKVLHHDKATDQDFASRFVREAQALSKLHHVNIVSVYHLGVSSTGLSYMAMECVEGKSIRTLLNESDKISVEQACAILARVSDALATAHNAGIVHRDLKPENIVLPSSGNPADVKVIDFGLAHFDEQVLGNNKEQQKLTTTGNLIGTSFYMSPEQCMGQKVDHRSDIYSLTACFFEMVSGRRPFDSDTAVGMLYQHINTPAPKISLADLDRYQPTLNEFVSKGMAKSPADRYQSMVEFSEQLRLLLSAPQESRGSRSRLPVIVIVAVICTVLVAGLSYSFLGIRQPTKPSMGTEVKPEQTFDRKKQSLSALNRLIDLSRQHSRWIITQDRETGLADERKILQDLESNDQYFGRHKDTRFISYLLRSHVLHALGRNDDAIDYANKALDASKTGSGQMTIESGEALKCLGNLYLWTNQLDKAESFSKKSIDLIHKSDSDPGSVPTIGTNEGRGGWPVNRLRIDPWITLGAMAEQKGEHEQALAYYKKAQDIADDFGTVMAVVECALTRATIYKVSLKKEKDARAIVESMADYVEERLKEALLKQNQLPIAMMMIGDWCKNNEMPELAAQVYRRALRYQRSGFATNTFSAIRQRLNSRR